MAGHSEFSLAVAARVRVNKRGAWQALGNSRNGTELRRLRSISDNEKADGQRAFLYRTGRRAPRGPKSKFWGQNRREIVKFLIQVFVRNPTMKTLMASEHITRS